MDVFSSNYKINVCLNAYSRLHHTYYVYFLTCMQCNHLIVKSFCTGCTSRPSTTIKIKYSREDTVQLAHVNTFVWHTLYIITNYSVAYTHTQLTRAHVCTHACTCVHTCAQMYTHAHAWYACIPYVCINYVLYYKSN